MTQWDYDTSKDWHLQQEKIWQMETRRAEYERHKTNLMREMMMQEMQAKANARNDIYAPRRMRLTVDPSWLASYEEALTEATAARWVVGL